MPQLANTQNDDTAYTGQLLPDLPDSDGDSLAAMAPDSTATPLADQTMTGLSATVLTIWDWSNMVPLLWVIFMTLCIVKVSLDIYYQRERQRYQQQKQRHDEETKRRADRDRHPDQLPDGP